MIQYRDGIGQDFLNPPRPVNFKIYAGGRFFIEGFCSLFNASNEKFSEGGMGEVLKFVTPDGRRVANEPTSSGLKPARA